MRRVSFLALLIALPLVADTEVCRWKAGPATNPITRFFAFPDVECHPASEKVPAGWNVMARSGDALISAGSDLKLVPAAKINAAVPSGASLFVFVPRTAFAIPGNVIPADTDVIPLLVKDGKIIAIANRVNVPAGKSANVAFDPPRANHVDVAVPVVFAPKSDPSIEAPQVLIGEKDKPIVALNKGTEATLLFFRDASPATLKLSGKRWKGTEAVVAGGSVVTLEPIVAKQTSKLIVNWWAPFDPAKLAAKEPECIPAKRGFAVNNEPRLKETTFVAIVSDCTPDPLKPGTRAQCKEFARKELPQDVLKGSFEVEDVPLGRYSIQFSYPGLPAIGAGAEVGSKETASVDVEIRYVTFFGKITRGGKPVKAMVFNAVSDPDSGEYTAVVTRLPPAGMTEVLSCDGAEPYRFVADAGPKENERFDIAIPDNRVLVEVVDKKTGAPVPKAIVGFRALVSGQPNTSQFSSRAGETDADGKLTITPVLENRTVRVCAFREDYEDACSPDFKMEGVAEKSVRIEVNRVQVRHGRVNAAPFTRGMVAWYSPGDGVPREMIRDFKEDGSFTYQRDHAAGDVVVFTASDRPLYAFPQPAIDANQTFEITLPPVASRSFTVSLPDTAAEGGSIALAVGGVIIPMDAVAYHIIPRRVQNYLEKGRTILISDVLHAGAIRVFFIPFSARLRFKDGSPAAADIAGFPSQEVGPDNAVTFP
jgi:hypothetical protein